MSTTVRDNFINAVLGEIIDLDSRTTYFKGLWRDASEMMGDAEVMDLPEWATTLSVEDHINTSTMAHQTLTLQNLDTAKNLLQKDQARGMAVEMRNWEKRFSQMGGGGAAYVRSFAEKLQVDLRNDRDTKDLQYMANVGAWQSGSSAPTTHHNQAGAALTFLMIQTVLARMLDQPGVGVDGLAFFLNSWGAASFRSLPQFIANMPGDGNRLGGPGIRLIGEIEGIPIYTGQGVQKNRSVATSAVSITSNVATATVAAGHGFVVGQKIYTTGLTTNIAAGAEVAITAVGATSISYPLTGSDGALADGVGTINAITTQNLLVNRRRIWQASEPVAGRMVPTSNLKTSDTMQIWEDYGRKARLSPSTGEADPGTVIVLHTASDAISVA